jgi:phosphatidylserine/phosphatidylglycerophosphate/cardiolipin synthase-like enzyme
LAGVHYVGDPHGVLAACLDLIRAAEESLVLQMYLFAENGDQTLLLPREGAFPYAALVADRLIEKKRGRPDLPMVVVLDSNTPADSALTRRKGRLVRERLEAAGIAVLVANLFGARFDPRRRLHPAMNLHLAPERVPASE